MVYLLQKYKKYEKNKYLCTHYLIFWAFTCLYYTLYIIVLEAHVNTEEEGARVRIAAVVDTCLCHALTH